MPPVLGYWNIRGLAEPIRLLLNYVGEEFEDKRYQCGPAPDFNRDTWLKEKQNLGLDFPNLPYYSDGKVNITQSTAILRYLGRKYNLDGNSDDEKIRMDLVMEQLADFRQEFVGLCYGGKMEQKKEPYLEALPQKLEAFEKFLGERAFFAGDKLTWVDFPFYEMMSHHTIFSPGCLDSFSKLKAFVERFEALPQIKKYRESDKFVERPLNNPSAAFK